MNSFIARLPVSAAIVALDENLTVLESNDRFIRLFSVPVHDLLSLADSQHRSALMLTVHRAAAGKSDAQCAFPVSGSGTYIKLSCSPLNTGDPSKLLCIFDDITEYEAAKTENQLWEARLSELSSLSGGTLAICSEDGTVSHYGSLFPSSHRPVPVRQFTRLLCDSGYLHNEDNDKLADFLLTAFNNSESRHISLRLRFDNLSYTHVDLSGTYSTVGKHRSFILLFPSGLGSQTGVSTIADPVTGVLSILSMESIVRQTLETRPDDTHALILVEIRHYKQLNESRGRQFGDAVMRDICRNIFACLTGSDFLGRYSGAVLCIFCKGLQDTERAYSLGEKIRQTIDEKFGNRTSGFHLRCNVGIAFTDGASDSCTELFRRADVDLFKSKNKNRSRFSIV